MCRFLTTLDETEQQALVARVDYLAKSGDKVEAVRVIRSLTGATWDQALATYTDWRTLSKSDKERWARAVLLQKAMQPQEIAEEDP